MVSAADFAFYDVSQTSINEMQRIFDWDTKNMIAIRNIMNQFCVKII